MMSVPHSPDTARFLAMLGQWLYSWLIKGLGVARSVRGAVMEISEYQRAARETSQLRLGGPHSAVAPMLGLASATGAILNVYKKYLRDGIDLIANREFLNE